MDINKFKATGTAEDGNIITIYTRKVLNNFKTKEAADFIYDFHPYIRIVSPGQKHSVVDTKMNADHKKRYPAHWEAFEKKESMRNNGTSLLDWTGVENSMIADLEALHIFTVEDMTNVSDAGLDNIGPGARKMRDRAKLFLAGTVGNDVELKKALRRIKKLEKLMKDAMANPVGKGKQDDAIKHSTGLSK